VESLKGPWIELLGNNTHGGSHLPNFLLRVVVFPKLQKVD
jgi:hypothetical protein